MNINVDFHQSGEELQRLMEKFMQCAQNADKNDFECKWLNKPLSEELTDKSADEIDELRVEIVRQSQNQAESYDEFRELRSQGFTREDCFISRLQKASRFASASEVSNYLNGLNNALHEANERMQNTVLTKSREINQNPNLDGYIAEQRHAQSYNLDAAARGNSGTHAEVLEPKPGEVYGKNSVDIVVKDTNTGRIEKRYQSKFGKDANATERMYKEGDYRGQQKLVPPEQQADISAKTTDKIETGDARSKPLTKAEAKELQERTQNGGDISFDWNDFDNWSLARGIGKEAAKSAALSAAISIGSDLAASLLGKKDLDGKEIAVNAVKGIVDTGAKTATTAALVTAVERGAFDPFVVVENPAVSVIARGPRIVIPAKVLPAAAAAVVQLGFENAKIAYKLIKGEMDLEEACEAMGDVTVSVTGGATAAYFAAPLGAGAAASIGALLGTTVGPIGTAIGGFIGGTLGYLAGSTLAHAVYSGVKQVASYCKEKIADGLSAVAGGIKSVADGIGNVFSTIFSWF